MDWFYAKDGKQEGPVDLATLQAKLQSGDLRPTDLVWKEGMAEWTAVEKVPEVSTPVPPEVPSSAAVTPAGSEPGAPVIEEKVPNYLVQAILVTVLCCIPLGIPAIVFAAKVDGLVARGDHAGAREASERAKMWCWISFGCGLVAAVGYIFVIILGGMSSEY